MLHDSLSMFDALLAPIERTSKAEALHAEMGKQTIQYWKNQYKHLVHSIERLFNGLDGSLDSTIEEHLRTELEEMLRLQGIAFEELKQLNQ